MTATVSVRNWREGPSAPQERADLPFSRLGISRAGWQALGHGVAPGRPRFGPCPAHTMSRSVATVVGASGSRG